MNAGSPRYFLGLVPAGLEKNHELKVLLGKMKRTLADQEKEVRWLPAELWHVTLLYLGALEESESKKAIEVFDNWKPASANKELKLDFHGIGAFSSVEEARVLWLGLARSQELVRLNQELERLYAEERFGIETREFVPHLSLVKFRNPTNVRPLVNLGGRKSFGAYKIAEVILFRSVLQGHFAKYIPLARKSLGALHNS